MSDRIIPPIRIHVSVLLPRDGKICLVRESDGVHKGRWNLPGGHLEFGEPLTAAALREVLEETGLKVSLKGLIMICSRVWGEVEKNHAIRFIFAADNLDAAGFSGDLETRMFASEDLDRLSDQELVTPSQIREALARFVRGEVAPMALFS